MNTSANNYDALERVIFETGVRIIGLSYNKEQDRFSVTLSSRTILHFKLSGYKFLQHATQEKLEAYELISGGLGVHWPKLDEDLSLKGFLEEELKLAIGFDSIARAA